MCFRSRFPCVLFDKDRDTTPEIPQPKIWVTNHLHKQECHEVTHAVAAFGAITISGVMYTNKGLWAAVAHGWSVSSSSLPCRQQTEHVTMERLLLNHLRPQVHHAEDPLQFAYREKVGVEDAILYLLHRTHSHLDKGGGAVRVMFFDFSSAFNTIQPLLLRDKLMKMEVDMHLVTWITDYLTGRPQHVRIRDCSSDTVISSTGAPQGTVLSPVLFTLYTSDFKYNSELCHMQKFSDDTAIVGCVRNGQEREYRSLVEDFVEWCTTNHLKLNITKTKEMCIDFRRSRPSQQPISIKGVDVEVVRSYRYLGVHLDERLDWSVNTDTVYKKAQSRLYFLRRLGSFRICQKLLLMFYQSSGSQRPPFMLWCVGGAVSARGMLDDSTG
ncbi:hypothetical protein NFI96_000034 [Prochilodus magdalenae]|nr:hypothetical protein NFI96_000034 [Prochilodus magdalenae]